MGWLGRSGKKGGNPLHVQRFASPETGRNQYLLTNATEAAVIDLDDAVDEVSRALDERGAHLRYMLATHGHHFCVRAVSEIRARLGGRFLIHEYDEELLKRNAPGVIPDGFLRDNMRLPLGALRIRVLHTPGHTRGSVSFWVKESRALFTGNTLLKGQQGRIWGPMSMSLMLFSLKRLGYTVPEGNRVYPGRGEETTLGQEGWIQCLRSA